MALGRRKRQRQSELWVPTAELPRAAGHPFYEKLNRLLAEARFDEFVEELCQPYYAEKLGRPGTPPGVYFRMLFVGYFEGLDSQRGIAWRCTDSNSLKTSLVPFPPEEFRAAGSVGSPCPTSACADLLTSYIRHGARTLRSTVLLPKAGAKPLNWKRH